MLENKWSERHITDSAQRILGQIRARALDRGLHVVDASSMALWSLLLWERKVGRVALERLGVDSYELARALDRLLIEKANENPVFARGGVAVLANSGEPYRGWDLDALLEPLLLQAEQEALAMGHTYVGSEHLALAVTKLADPTLFGLLQQHGVSHSRLTEPVQAVLQS